MPGAGPDPEGVDRSRVANRVTGHKIKGEAVAETETGSVAEIAGTGAPGVGRGRGNESETEAENERRNEREGGAGTNQGAETAGETRNPGAEIARPINGGVERGRRTGRGGGEIVAAAVAVVVVAAAVPTGRRTRTNRRGASARKENDQIAGRRGETNHKAPGGTGTIVKMTKTDPAPVIAIRLVIIGAVTPPFTTACVTATVYRVKMIAV